MAQARKKRQQDPAPRPDPNKRLDYPGIRPGGQPREDHTDEMQEYQDRTATTRGAMPERTTPEEEAKRGESGTGTVKPGNFPEQNHGRWETDGEEVRTETRKNIGDRLTNLVDPEDDDPYDEARRGQGGAPAR